MVHDEGTGIEKADCRKPENHSDHIQGFTKEEPLRFDLLVEECVLIEAKSVEHILPIHKAQLLSYMKLLNVPVGLLINFNAQKRTDGISRLILPGANL